MIYDPNSGTIIMTGDGQNLKEQMRTQMREQFRYHGNMKSVHHEFENGYREGYREGYEQAMRDAKDMHEEMSPAEHESYMKGQRDAYGRNGAENRNQL